MKIYKFGGASVKDAKGVRNLLKILQEIGYDNSLIVLSAMGKMTNAFEKIADSYCAKRKDLDNHINHVIFFHENLIAELFIDLNHPIYEEVNLIFDELKSFIKTNTNDETNFIYDQIVSKAELISTKICSFFLMENQIENTWLDVRKCIKTNSDFRQAIVNWDQTFKSISKNVHPNKLYITQGFISSDEKNRTTTLGREGSDYSAGIIAYCLEAKEVIIFKDVDGVLNADPKSFKNTTLLDQISYKEAIEMAFYGASVIHPKTLQPLQRKEIPLFVKSFNNPENKGTVVGNGEDILPRIPCFIRKENQILLSLSTKDFSFFMEEDISEVFDLFHKFKIKVNLIQNSAISFSVCIEDIFGNFRQLIKILQLNYSCLYNKNVSLYTIRHFTNKSILEIENEKEILIKQLSRETVQLVTKNK